MAAASISKENVFSTVRALFIFAGTLLIGHGHNLFGQPLDAQSWETISGAVVALGMAIWGMKTKDTTIEGIESLLRSALQGVGGLLVGGGIITGATLNSILGILAAVAPLLQSYASKAKTAQIVSGQIEPIVADGKPTGMLVAKVPPVPDTNVAPEPVKQPDAPKPWWKGKP